MPKERTHWHLARRAAAAVPSGPLADAVLAYPELVLLGAVSHDTGYYALGNPRAKAAADRVHGTLGADPFAPFRALADHRQTAGAAGLAFAFGALTHLAADTIFHPFVYSWTGDFEAPDPELRAGWLYRHQACETALDLHLEALWGPAPAQTYGRLSAQAGPVAAPLVDAFLDADASAWRRAHAQLQGLFHRGWAAWAARVLALGHSGDDGDQSAAFYRGPAVRHPAFDGILTWVDPVTGAPGAATLDDLAAAAVDRAVVLGTRLAEAWTSGAVPFADEVGPALDTGLPADRPQTKAWFEPKWF